VCCWQFWRNRRLLAAGWRPGGAGGRGHGVGAETGGEGRAPKDQSHHWGQFVAGGSSGASFSRAVTPSPVNAFLVLAAGDPY
jgi:hypothetical protein